MVVLLSIGTLIYELYVLTTLHTKVSTSRASTKTKHTRRWFTLFRNYFTSLVNPCIRKEPPMLNQSADLFSHKQQQATNFDLYLEIHMYQQETNWIKAATDHPNQESTWINFAEQNKWKIGVIFKENRDNFKPTFLLNKMYHL